MMERSVDYEFLILEELKSYRLYHTQEETLQFMRDIIEQNEDVYVPLVFKSIDKEILSNYLSKMVLNQIQSNNIKNKFDLTSLLPSIIKNNIKVIELDKNKSSTFKHAILIGAVVTAISLIGISNIKHYSKSDSSTAVTSVNSATSSIKNINVSPSVITTINDMDKVCKLKLAKKKKIRKNNKKTENEKVLNNFKKVNSLSDILKRQNELESLNLDDSYKIYKKCKLSPAIQRFIYEQSIINKIPVDFMFSIIATESREQFNSSGEESYNAPGNYDLGLTQQNTKSALVTFRKKYGLSYDKAYELLKNNDYVNVVSSFLEIKEIASHFDSFDAEEYAGCYNGWLRWRNYSISRQYVSIFKKYYYNEFVKHHDLEDTNIKKEKVKELSMVK